MNSNGLQTCLQRDTPSFIPRVVNISMGRQDLDTRESTEIRPSDESRMLCFLKRIEKNKVKFMHSANIKCPLARGRGRTPYGNAPKNGS